MNWTAYTFYFFAGLTLASALFILFTQQLLYAVLALLVTFLGVAALYVLAGAEFVAVTQLVVYVGGVLVLMLFGVMLTNRVAGKDFLISTHRGLNIGILLGSLMLAALGTMIIQHDYSQQPWIKTAQEAAYYTSSSSDTRTLGLELMTQYGLAFELIALLLTAALIGAAFLASKATSTQEENA